MFERLSSRVAWLSVLAGLWLCALPPEAGSGRTSLAYLEPVSEARLPEVRTSILVYHRFGPVVADSMTVRTRTFRWQLEYLREHGYEVIPLPVWMAWRLRLGPPPPAACRRNRRASPACKLLAPGERQGQRGRNQQRGGGRIAHDRAQSGGCDRHDETAGGPRRAEARRETG
jgi:hypothetical protein